MQSAAGSNGVRRAGGGTGLGERRPASAGGMGEAGSALEMWRLEAPVRDKPGIDQHRRRALHQNFRGICSDIEKQQRHRAVTRYEAPFESLWAVTVSGAHRNP